MGKYDAIFLDKNLTTVTPNERTPSSTQQAQKGAVALFYPLQALYIKKLLIAT